MSNPTIMDQTLLTFLTKNLRHSPHMGIKFEHEREKYRTVNQIAAIRVCSIVEKLTSTASDVFC